MVTMRTGIALAAALLVAGCVQTTPKWDRQFGDTVRANTAAQVLNPAAAANTNPAAGIDGRAARAAHERYERSFAEPAANGGSTLINSAGGAK
jgi:hypothetical protein